MPTVDRILGHDHSLKRDKAHYGSIGQKALAKYLANQNPELITVGPLYNLGTEADGITKAEIEEFLAIRPQVPQDATD